MTVGVYNIGLIGAGQIGSRHLQGLAKSTLQYKIYVVDPDEKSLSVAKIRYQEVSPKNTSNTVTFSAELDQLPDVLDVLIIATPSHIRRNVIEKLVKKFIVQYIILEKIVFQKSDDFLPIFNLFAKKNIRSWINCWRRSFSLYKDLKKELYGHTLVIKASGTKWGLGCNAIHLIDLLVFLTGQTDLFFCNDKLDKEIYPAKREGFKEFRGDFVVKTTRGDVLKMTDSDGFAEGSLGIAIKVDNLKFFIDEDSGNLVINSSNSQTEKKKISTPYQSETTGLLVDQIIQTRQSDLTPFAECMNYHIPMLDSFNKHITKVTGSPVQSCPIT
jgi:hypothetical protein